MYSHIHAVKNTTICQIVSLCNNQHYVIYNYMFRPCKLSIIRLFVEPVSWLYEISSPLPNSYCIIKLLVLRTTWWWPTYKPETCSCILRSVTYCIVILSDKLLCFWLHVCVNIHIIIYIVLLPNVHLPLDSIQYSSIFSVMQQHFMTRCFSKVFLICSPSLHG